MKALDSLNHIQHCLLYGWRIEDHSYMKKIKPGQQIDQSLLQQQSQQLLLQISFVHTRSSNREKYCQRKQPKSLRRLLLDIF